MKRYYIQSGWSSLTPEKLKSTRKAMRKYRKEHKYCEITGTDKKIQIHHIVPIWANPVEADHPDNFIALSSSAHIHHIFGHDKNFSQKYVENVKEIAYRIKEIQKEMEVVERDSIASLNYKKSFFKEMYIKFVNFLLGV